MKGIEVFKLAHTQSLCTYYSCGIEKKLVLNYTQKNTPVCNKQGI